MAEYYPLLAKAIAGLPNSTPETRRAVYERARKALLGQLQNLQPPVPAADLARETESLDAAVARLEAELSGVAPPAPQPPAPQPPAPQPPAQPPSAGRSPAAQPPVRPPLRPLTPPSRPAPPRPQTPPAASQPAAPPLGSRRANGVPALDEPAGETNGRAQPKIEPAPPTPSFDAPSEPPQLRQQGREPRLDVPPGREPAKEPRPEPPRMRLSEPVRPIAPQQDLGDAPIGRRLWIVIGVVVVLVALVAVAAWKLRDRPDQLTAFNRPQNQTTADTNSTKNTQRVGDADMQPAAPAPAAPEVQPAPAPANPAPAPPKPADSNATLPVAYRAALLVEAPDEPNKVKTYVGTVVWKLENVSNGPGQPLSTAVHADIDVPDDKLKVTVDIQKNTDPSLSASHTITVVFTPGAGSPTGGVKEISAPQLRSEDSPSGDALKGVVVPIMDNSFLVGLTRGDTEDANIDLLKKLEWIDIPIMLNNGRIAKLTFEKNASGSRAINDAFTSWQGQ
jgi:hypothetical protein